MCSPAAHFPFHSRRVPQDPSPSWNTYPEAPTRQTYASACLRQQCVSLRGRISSESPHTTSRRVFCPSGRPPTTSTPKRNTTHSDISSILLRWFEWGQKYFTAMQLKIRLWTLNMAQSGSKWRVTQRQPVHFITAPLTPLHHPPPPWQTIPRRFLAHYPTNTNRYKRRTGTASPHPTTPPHWYLNVFVLPPWLLLPSNNSTPATFAHRLPLWTSRHGSRRQGALVAIRKLSSRITGCIPTQPLVSALLFCVLPPFANSDITP